MMKVKLNIIAEVKSQDEEVVLLLDV